MAITLLGSCSTAILRQRAWRFCAAGLLLAYLLTACSEPQSSDAYLAEAIQLHEEGDYPAALIAYKNSLQVNPEQTAARHQLGRLYLLLGQFAAADKELARAQQLIQEQRQKPDIGVSADRAKALLALERYEDVLALPVLAAEEAVSSLPASAAAESRGLPVSPEVHASLSVSRGLAYLAQGQLQAATAEMAVARNLAPGLEYGRYGAARLQLRAGDREGARRTLDALLTDNPDQAEYWALAARIARLEGDFVAAEQALTEAIQHAANPDLHRLSRAMIRLRLERLDDAAADLQQLGAEARSLPGYHYTQGLLSTLRGDYASARLAFDQVLDVAEEYLPALFHAGVAHYQTGHYELARDALARYVDRVPDDPDAVRMLADVRLQLGDGAGAQRLLLSLLREYPQDLQSLSLLTKTLLVAGNHQDAITVLQAITELNPQSAEAQLTLARTYLQQDQASDAVAVLQRAEAADIVHPELQALLIQAYLQAGSQQQALQLAEQRVEQQPTVMHLNQLAATQLVIGNSEGAQAAYQRVLALEPDNPEANLGLAALALEQNDAAQARAYMNASLKGHPQHLQTLVSLADLSLAEGDSEAFVEILQRAREAAPESLAPRLRLGWYYSRQGEPALVRSLLRPILDSHPQHPLVLQLLGSSAFQLQRYEEARDLLVRLLSLQPGNADVHYALAMTAAELGDGAMFRRELGYTLQLQPGHRRARIDLSGWLLENGRLAEAEQQLQPLLEQPVTDPVVLRLQARLAERQGDIPQALALYEQVYAQTGARMDVLRLSQVLQASGDLAKSQDLLQRWLAQYPEDALVHLQHARQLMEAGQNEAAVRAYEKALALSPDSPVALNNLAWLLRDSQTARALEYAEQAERLQPESLDIKDTLAMVLLSDGRPEALRRASRLLERILVSRPDNPSVLYHSARVALAQGDEALARQQLQQVLSSDRAFKEQAEARALMATLTQ